MKVALGLTLLLTFGLATALFADTIDTSPAAQPDSSARQFADSVTATATGAQSTSDQPVYPMSPERHERLVSYSKFVNVWRFVDFFIGLIILAVILFSGLSARLRDWSLKIHLKFFALWVFLVLFLLADYLFNLPFSIYRNFVVERSYGFMNQSFMQWWGEDLLGLLVTAALMIIPVWFFYWVVNRLKQWWLWFSLGTIPFAVLIVVVAPVVIAPLFNDFAPMKDKQLEAQILDLARQGGIDGARVFEVDASKQSSKINAYMTGLFGTKRIVLYDTLIKNFSPSEVRFVMAHEMGHYLKHHLWIGLAIAIAFIMVALWLASRLLPVTIYRLKDGLRFDRLGDYASWPLVLAYLYVFMFIFQPITNGASRWMERQSDDYAMRMSRVDGETAATAFDKLSVFNLSDPDPSPLVEFWFYDHPALKERMKFARNWKP